MRPLLDPEAQQNVGRLSLHICWPCVAFISIGAAVHIDDLKKVWPIPIWFFVQALVSLFLGAVSVRILRLDQSFSRAFILSCCFGNGAAVPMLMMNVLCEEEFLRSEFLDYDECVNQSYSAIMLFVAAWSFTMFGVAVPIVQGVVNAKPNTPVTTEVPLPLDPDQTLRSRSFTETPLGKLMMVGLCGVAQSTPIIGTLAGLCVGLCLPLSDALFRHTGPLRVVAGALETLAEPLVSCMTLVCAAALVPSDKALKKPLPLYVVLSLCLVRLFLIPAVGFAMVYGVMVSGLLPSADRLQWLLVFVEWAVPSSQTSIIVFVSMKLHDLGSKIAFSYVFMYPMSIVTLAAWTTFAQYLIQAHEDGSLT